MKHRNFIFILTFSLLSAMYTGCKKKTVEEETPDAGFDRSEMLSNYADQIIVPNLNSFKSDLNLLVNSFDNFVAAKTGDNLNTVRQNYINTYIGFQHISSFEFGPAESEIIRSNFNTYPLDVGQVNANITSGNYNLGTLNNLDAKGLPLIDFLLYGKNESSGDIMSLFTSDNNAQARIAYMKACLNEMQTKTNNIVNGWNNGYRNTFIASTGSQIGSSLGMLVNQLDFEVDLLKNAKTGIPLGKKSLGGILPEKCEAYYQNNISVKLAKECLLNIEDTYLGRSQQGNDGAGIDDLLESLKAMHGTETLNSAIKNQFAVTKAKLDLVPEPLSSSVASASSVVDAAYMEMVKLLVLLKTDTPSALGIVITYQDGDGD